MNKKITFLVLHLGYGGIETSVINTVNALCKYYEIEIVSLYNLKNNQEKLIDSRVVIKHLYNGEPNKEQFLTCLRNKKFFKLILEGFKATKIIYLKNKLINNYIKQSNSKIIISTRSEFSKKLSKYKNKNCVAIAQEHHHHNDNRKYIKILEKKYTNIDYLFALTNGLKEDYKVFLKENLHTKIVVMPNMIVESKSISKLDTNNIIFIGRLHSIKRVDELVEIASKCKNIDKFYIVGDGEEYENIVLKIKELKLSDKIILTGYKNKNEIEKYINDSSLFVMASVSEGLPMVLLEAMNSGLPCIAYKTLSGVTDIIDDNINGYVISERNQKEYIEKLDYLISNKELLKKFSKEAIKKSNEFTSKSIEKKWKRILDKYL